MGKCHIRPEGGALLLTQDPLKLVSEMARPSAAGQKVPNEV